MPERVFTPGIWFRASYPGDNLLAETPTWYIRSQSEYTEDDDDANSRLIIAAPRLYAELKALFPKAVELRMLSAGQQERIEELFALIEEAANASEYTR